MYATEKYVKMEAKQLRESIGELASDLGGDIKYLHQELLELAARLESLEQTIISMDKTDES